MIVVFCIDFSTVGGTPSSVLRMPIPDGKTCAHTVRVPIRTANTTRNTGIAVLQAGDTKILFFKSVDETVNWSLGTDNTSVQGQVIFEIE
jgi:hypothetical protein